MASFSTGHKKVGGRPKGMKNKDKRSLLEICEKKKLDPFEALIELAKTTSDENTKFKCLKELCEYCYPKKKAVEISGPEGGPVNVNSEKVQAEVRELEELYEKRFERQAKDLSKPK